MLRRRVNAARKLMDRVIGEVVICKGYLTPSKTDDPSEQQEDNDTLLFWEHKEASTSLKQVNITLKS